MDPETGEERIKLYTDKTTNELKGDALISYANESSVDLALQQLNGREIEPGYKLTVERAQFEQKGDYQPREHKQIDDLAKIKYKAHQERQLGWHDDDDLVDGLKIVILKNAFDQTEFDDATRDEFFQYLEADIRPELERVAGPVKRFQIYKDNPDGVLQVKFEKGAAAEKCIAAINGRQYNGHTIECFYWDGKTNYKVVKESEEEVQRRIDEFGKWLGGQIDANALLK